MYFDEALYGVNSMYDADWITDGIEWWGEQLWLFMQNLPPYEWIESPLYEVKLVIYSLPLILIILLPLLLFIWSSRRKRKEFLSQIKIVKHKFSCPHCGHTPRQPPVSGTYYCGKCGKSTTISKIFDSSSIFT